MSHQTYLTIKYAYVVSRFACFFLLLLCWYIHVLLCHLRSGGGAPSAPPDSEEVTANSVTTPTTTGNGVASQVTSQTPVSSLIQFINDMSMYYLLSMR